MAEPRFVEEAKRDGLRAIVNAGKPFQQGHQANVNPFSAQRGRLAAMETRSP